jgi:hypothetical protein
MFRSARVVLLTGCAVVAIAAGAAPAGADSPRQYVETSDFTLSGYCAFDVAVHFVRSNEYVIRETTLPDGTVIDKITGNLAVELTNLSTGETRTYQINGPGTATFYPDGSFSVEAAGPNLYWTLPENLPESPAGVPTLSYTTGYIAFAVDANGRTTSYVHQGATTDVCAQLA